MSETEPVRKPMDHPDYRIPGTNAFNLSKWSRENEPKPPHTRQVGDVVVLTVVGEITGLTFDCDGTALYSVDGQYHGHGEAALTDPKEAQLQEDGWL